MTVDTYQSPCGTLWLGDHAESVALCDWRCPRVPYTDGTTPLLLSVEKMLDDYFSGGNPDFNLPLQPWGTAFQLRVWDALRSVGYGQTATYADIARALGIPASVRAVASAIGRNPISIIIPCHRIIGSDGSLRGYRGGLEAKRLLLQLE